MTEKRRRARTAALTFRIPWLLGTTHHTPKPGDTALVDATMLRNIAKAIRRGRTEGRLSVEDARTELAEVGKGLAIIEQGPHRDVGAYFPIDGCIEPRDISARGRHERNKAARKARKAQRPKKKRRR